MQWGPEDVKGLLQLWKESGVKPQALVNKPRLKPGDDYYYKAFWELSTSRPSGEAFGSIPQNQYLAWWQSWSVNSMEERDRFQRVVSRLDQQFVSHTNKARKKAMEDMKNGGGRTTPAKGSLVLK